MRKRRFYPMAVLLVLLLVAYPVSAQYWFQSGARASASSNGNSGASVVIQTVLPQNVSDGSMAFWVGENLANGAFLQIGYTIFNRTGEVPNNCTATGCSGTQQVTAGKAEWFFEYFPPGNNSSFYGTIGPDGSAGPNGAFNTYSFYSNGTVWYFEVNGSVVGGADLGTSKSGAFTPTAIAELANTSTSGQYMSPVIFANLSEYKYGQFLPVQSAYGVVSYGTGSETKLRNPYGIKEIGNRVNYFEVGSGLPVSNNNTQLWSLGYRLTIASQYGNMTSRNVYMAYTLVTLSAPSSVVVGPGAIAIFKGWTGTGRGSYTGTAQSQALLMASNITETANWQVDYFVNVSSQYGTAKGSGWYPDGSAVNYSASGTSLVSGGKEFRFVGWSNGQRSASGTLRVTGPANITAEWQYRVTLSGADAYGKAIGIDSVVIDNGTMNVTPFLNANSVSEVTGAYYKGVLLPVTQSIAQNSTPDVSLTLPVYNVFVRTYDMFGIPINATATMFFKNGSSETTYSGQSGTISVADVPYGYASLGMDYFGQRQLLIAQDGDVVTAIFISPVDMLAIAIAIAAVVVALSLLVHRHVNKDAGKQQRGMWVS